MARSPKQLLLSPELKPRYEHGGSLVVGKRKRERPISTKQALHLVFRAQAAKGALSLLLPKHVKIINALKNKCCRKYGIRVYEYANAGNHLHFLIRAQTKEGLQSFLRVFAGQTAQKITGAIKGKPLGKRFWTHLVYSKIVSWGRAFKTAKAYVFQNTLEALGIIPYRSRGQPGGDPGRGPSRSDGKEASSPPAAGPLLGRKPLTRG